MRREEGGRGGEIERERECVYTWYVCVQYARKSLSPVIII